jgi:hypothetical protein
MTFRRAGKTFLVLAVVGWLFAGQFIAAQGDGSRRTRGAPKPVTVPVTIKVSQPEREIRVVDLLVREDGDVQSLLSIRRPADSPITLAVRCRMIWFPQLDRKRRVADFVRLLPDYGDDWLYPLGSLEVAQRLRQT